MSQRADCFVPITLDEGPLADPTMPPLAAPPLEILGDEGALFLLVNLRKEGDPTSSPPPLFSRARDFFANFLSVVDMVKR